MIKSFWVTTTFRDKDCILDGLLGLVYNIMVAIA
jgi:hypothetical protein